MSDGRSRVSRRARKIERELRDEYGPWTSPLQVRRARRAAELLALADMTVGTMGMDPRSTRRALTALQREADAQLAALLAITNGHGKTPDLAQALAALHRDREGAGR